MQCAVMGYTMCASCGSVEKAVDEANGVDAEIPPDRRVLETGPYEQLRGVERARRDDHGARMDDVALALRIDVLDPPCLRSLDQDTLDRRVRAQVQPIACERLRDVRVHGRLTGVRRTALQTGAAPHAVRVRVRPDRLELAAERAKAPLHREDALGPIAALPHPEHLLDAVVVRGEVGRGERLAALVRQAACGVPLGDVPLVRTECHLGVDRRRAAHAATGEERNGLAARERREAKRPEEVVRRLRLPAREVRGRTVRPGLEQQHVTPTLRQLTRDDTAAGAGPDHDNVELVPRAHASAPGA